MVRFRKVWGVLGGFGGVLRGSGFDSKQHRMVQLTRVIRVGITDQFLNL